MLLRSNYHHNKHLTYYCFCCSLVVALQLVVSLALSDDTAGAGVTDAAEAFSATVNHKSHESTQTTLAMTPPLFTGLNCTTTTSSGTTTDSSRGRNPNLLNHHKQQVMHYSLAQVQLSSFSATTTTGGSHTCVGYLLGHRPKQRYFVGLHSCLAGYRFEPNQMIRVYRYATTNGNEGTIGTTTTVTGTAPVVPSVACAASHHNASTLLVGTAIQCWVWWSSQASSSVGAKRFWPPSVRGDIARVMLLRLVEAQLVDNINNSTGASRLDSSSEPPPPPPPPQPNDQCAMHYYQSVECSLPPLTLFDRANQTANVTNATTKGGKKGFFTYDWPDYGNCNHTTTSYSGGAAVDCLQTDLYWYQCHPVVVDGDADDKNTDKLPPPLEGFGLMYHTYDDGGESTSATTFLVGLYVGTVITVNGSTVLVFIRLDTEQALHWLGARINSTNANASSTSIDSVLCPPTAVVLCFWTLTALLVNVVPCLIWCWCFSDDKCSDLGPNGNDQAMMAAMGTKPRGKSQSVQVVPNIRPVNQLSAGSSSKTKKWGESNLNTNRYSNRNGIKQQSLQISK